MSRAASLPAIRCARSWCERSERVNRSEFVDWSVENGVGRLTLDRPPLNILSIAMLREMLSIVKQAAAGQRLKALVLRAEGTVFSAGVDVADHTPEKVGEMIPLFDQTCVSLAEFPAPTLAAVQGSALGGGFELVSCCDLVVASELARFGQPEIKLGVIAPVAALRLPRQIGGHRAAELLMMGTTIDATKAFEMGLVNRLVPADQFEATVEVIINELTSLSAAALRACKRAVRLGTDEWVGLKAVERLYLEELMATQDAQEGLAAFLEKRPPVWTDR